MIRYKIKDGKIWSALSKSQLTEETAVDILNQQSTRINELETWFRLLLHDEPTFENVKTLKPRAGHDVCGRKLKEGQVVTIYPEMYGLILKITDDLVQVSINGDDEDIRNIPIRQTMLWHDPSPD